MFGKLYADDLQRGDAINETIRMRSLKSDETASEL